MSFQWVRRNHLIRCRKGSSSDVRGVLLHIFEISDFDSCERASPGKLCDAERNTQSTTGFMKRDQLSTADTMRLVEVYRDAAKQHGEATEAGDHKTANRSADLISEVYAELRQRGADAQRALLPLLTDPASGVRLWSASHAL